MQNKQQGVNSRGILHLLKILTILTEQLPEEIRRRLDFPQDTSSGPQSPQDSLQSLSCLDKNTLNILLKMAEKATISNHKIYKGSQLLTRNQILQAEREEINNIMLPKELTGYIQTMLPGDKTHQIISNFKLFFQYLIYHLEHLEAIKPEAPAPTLSLSDLLASFFLHIQTKEEINILRDSELSRQQIQRILNSFAGPKSVHEINLCITGDFQGAIDSANLTEVELMYNLLNTIPIQGKNDLLTRLGLDPIDPQSPGQFLDDMSLRNQNTLRVLFRLAQQWDTIPQIAKEKNVTDPVILKNIRDTLDEDGLDISRQKLTIEQTEFLSTILTGEDNPRIVENFENFLQFLTYYLDLTIDCIPKSITQKDRLGYLCSALFIAIGDVESTYKLFPNHIRLDDRAIYHIMLNYAERKTGYGIKASMSGNFAYGIIYDCHKIQIMNELMHLFVDTKTGPGLILPEANVSAKHMSLGQQQALLTLFDSYPTNLEEYEQLKVMAKTGTRTNLKNNPGLQTLLDKIFSTDGQAKYGMAIPADKNPEILRKHVQYSLENIQQCVDIIYNNRATVTLEQFCDALIQKGEQQDDSRNTPSDFMQALGIALVSAQSAVGTNTPGDTEGLLSGNPQSKENWTLG